MIVTDVPAVGYATVSKSAIVARRLLMYPATPKPSVPMRFQVLVMVASLLLVAASPAAASGSSLIVPADGTYTHGVQLALAQFDAVEADDDSSRVAPALIVGGAVGLAALFVLNSGDDPAGPAGSPFAPGGGITLPPPDQFTPLAPTPTFLPPTGTDPTIPETTIPTTVTPEPVSMALLATGLAGMGGAQLAKRRRGRRIRGGQ